MTGAEMCTRGPSGTDVREAHAAACRRYAAPSSMSHCDLPKVQDLYGPAVGRVPWNGLLDAAAIKVLDAADHHCRVVYCLDLCAERQDSSIASPSVCRA